MAATFGSSDWTDLPEPPTDGAKCQDDRQEEDSPQNHVECHAGIFPSLFQLCQVSLHIYQQLLHMLKILSPQARVKLLSLLGTARSAGLLIAPAEGFYL